MKKKILAVLLAAAMTASMAACSGGGEEESSGTEAQSGTEESSETANDDSEESGGETVDTSDLSIGVVMKLYDEFQNKVIDGANAAAEEVGAKITSVAPDDITDAAQQVQMIENFI